MGAGVELGGLRVQAESLPCLNAQYKAIKLINGQLETKTTPKLKTTVSGVKLLILGINKATNNGEKQYEMARCCITSPMIHC